jgi:hopanoid C-3 methylase
MKILLVQPPKSARTIGGEDIHLFEPLSLEYVGAGVVDDHEVELLDLRLEGDLVGVLTRLEPRVVGLTALTVHLNVVLELAETIKTQLPETLVVVGGHHATVAPDGLVSEHIDVVISGEGVVPFRELVRRLEAGQDYRDLPGVGTVEDGQLKLTPPATDLDLDDLPLPARSLSARHRGRFHSQWMSPMAAVITSMGCPFRCSYCAIWRLTDGKRLTRSPRKLLEEIQSVDEPYVFFADYESLVDVERMAELARLIADSGVRKRYTLYSRSDTIVKHPDLLQAWRDVGLDTVIVGFEFFRDEDLEAVNKGATTADNEQAIEVLQSMGINIGAYFLVRPEFDRDDFAQLRTYVKGLKLRFASFFVLTPLPGTDLYDERSHEMTTDDPELFDFFHALLPTTLPLDEFYEEMYRCYRAPISLGSALSLLSNWPLTKVPAAVSRTRRALERLRKAHLDHG